MTDETRDQVWEFLRVKTEEHPFRAVPLKVLRSVCQGWSASNHYRRVSEQAFTAALTAAGYELHTGDSGDVLVRGLKMLPMGEENAL